MYTAVSFFRFYNPFDWCGGPEYIEIANFAEHLFHCLQPKLSFFETFPHESQTRASFSIWEQICQSLKHGVMFSLKALKK